MCVAVVVTVTRSRRAERVRVPLAAAPGALDVEDLRASRGVPLRLDPPPPLLPPMVVQPPLLRVEPSQPAPPPTAELTEVPLESRPDAPPAASEPLQVVAGGDRGSEVGTDPYLRMRTLVQPDYDERVVQKRRIDAAVTMQVRVGPDGRVEDVRVVRGIPNCEECNRAAVAAAWKLVYDAPVNGSVWAAPFEMRFSHGRGR
jgi:TonB family protein